MGTMGLDLAVACSSFYSSSQNFFGLLASMSRKIWLTFRNVTSISVKKNYIP